METLAAKPIRKSSRQPWKFVLLALVVWISVDLLVPVQHSIRQFDPNEVAKLETAMWRSYYQKKPVLLFWQLATGLRQQFHAPFWRSFKLGFQASKAAFDFKKGKSRAEYQRALPGLITYYKSIQALSTDQFDVKKLAELELDWWIIHRQRERYSYTDLANALSQTAAVQYNQPAAAFVLYGQIRADAMRLRDESSQQVGGTTEADWQRIEVRLNKAWESLHEAVRGLPSR